MLFLLPLAYWQYYAKSCPELVCRLYRDSYQVGGVIFFPFLLAVTIELAEHMVGRSPAERRSFTLATLAALAALATVRGVMAFQGLPENTWPAKILGIEGRISALGIAGAAFVLLRVRRYTRTAAQGNIMLIGVAASTLSLLEIVFTYMSVQGRNDDLFSQTSYLAFALTLCIALARNPMNRPAISHTPA